MIYRISFLILVATFSINSASGQFAVDSAENYQIGNERQYALGYTDSIQNIQGGADTTWDFTHIGLQDSLKQQILDPDSTENGSEFPDATFVESYTNGNRFFHNRQPGGNLYTGLKSFQDMLIDFIRPFKVIERPFAYKQTHLDTGRREYTFNSFTVQGTGHIRSEALGWGTIQLPDTTFDSTLLVYNQQIWQDTGESFLGDVVIDNKTVSYVWFTPDRSYPLLRLDSIKISSSVTNDTSGTLQYYYPSKEKDSEDTGGGPGARLKPEQPDIDAYYAENQILLEGDLSKSRHILIELSNLKGQRLLRQEKTIAQGTNRTSMPVDHLTPGIYILQMRSADSDQILLNQKVMVH